MKNENKKYSAPRVIPRSLYAEGGAKPEQWRQFILGEDLEMDPQAYARFSGNFVWAEHGDQECTFSHPRVDNRTPNFFNYPRVDGFKK